MAGSDKLPKFADWIVTAGGTQSHESQDGYHVRGPFGEYHLWPIAGYGGRKRGSYYIVQFANTPHFDPDQRGLWRDLGRASSPRKAYAIAKAHHEDVRARRAGRTSNPRRRNTDSGLRETQVDYKGVKRQWDMPSLPPGWRVLVVELWTPRHRGRIKFEGKFWIDGEEISDVSGTTLRDVWDMIRHDIESESRRRTNPIRSKAQWRALAAKAQRGEISKRQWREMVRETKRGYRRLPERVGRRTGKRKRRTTRRRNPPRSYAGWSEKQLYARLNKLIDQHQRNLESIEYGDAIYYDATPIMREMEGIDRVLRNRRAFARDQRRRRR